MGPRNIDQILAEVSAKSDPQRQIVMRQIADLPNQQIAAESGLDAKRDRGFEDINLGARRKGVAYWGAPIAEQQKYLATDYLPAAANLKSSFNERRNTLDSALADIGRSDYTTANDLFNNDRNFYEQQRRFNEELAMKRQEAAASARTAASPTVGGGGQSQTNAAAVNPVQQDAYNDVRNRISSMSAAQVKADYNATAKSAGYGNQRDKFKLEFYAQLRPDLFRGVSANALGNGGQLRF